MNQTATDTERKIEKFSRDEWLARGKALFGEDFMKWKFKCPICGNVASMGDFRQYKDKGAQPDSAATGCIGRFSGGRSAFYDKGSGPCDYAAFGFFKLTYLVVVQEDGTEQHVFPFAEED